MKIKILIKYLVVFIISLNFTGCILAKSNVSTTKQGKKIEQVYKNTNVDKVIATINNTIKNLDWVKLGEYRNILSEDKKSWKLRARSQYTDNQFGFSSVTYKSKLEDLIFIKLRTPIGLTSYGATLFIGINVLPNDTVILKYAGSTSQYFEKKKLPGYLEVLSQKIKNGLSTN
ncbi:MAG: hypothetical protein WA916_01135 [Arcobacter sp.]|uniref:hypothetical protein n=1 Tax=Arcobacter sp. TaxID=1872629 RepID=UPI003C78C3DE